MDDGIVNPMCVGFLMRPVGVLYSTLRMGRTVVQTKPH